MLRNYDNVILNTDLTQKIILGRWVEKQEFVCVCVCECVRVELYGS